MSAHSLKSEILDLTLSVVSSGDDQVPIPLTSANYHPTDRRVSAAGTSRRGSTGSIQRSLEVIRRSLTGDSSNNVDCTGFSIKDIYGELEEDEIEIQRMVTRNTILSELISRNHELEDEVETMTSTDDSRGRRRSSITSSTTSNGASFMENEKQNYHLSNKEPICETTIAVQNYGQEFNKIDPELITWNGQNDPEDPRNWKSAKKIFLVAFVSAYALVAPMSSSMISPAMSEISQQFNIDNPIIQAMVVSIQILAWAIGPLLIAPLSEHENIGRKLVLDVSVWMCLFFNIGCAVSQLTLQLMVCRFCGGLFGCVALSVCAGVISDMYDAHERNLPLAGYALCPLLGPIIAPVVSGFIVENMNWRWTLYVLCIFNAIVAVVGTIFFCETYTPTLLKWKASKLRKLTGNNNLHTIYEITNGETFMGKMYITMTRPVKLLFLHPMIVGLGSFMAFTYGFMYLMIVSFPEIFHQTYGFNRGITGLMYLPMGVGFVLGVVFWTWSIGKTYQNLTNRNNGIGKPEFRLPMLIASSWSVPVGLIWFGWSAEKQLHWIMPGIGSGIFAFGLVCVFQSTQSYLIDMSILTTTKGVTETVINFSSSSVAAAALFRSLFGFSFPLFANKMYGSMGYGWANTMCAFIGLILGIPFPIVCYVYGERIRLWANKKIERSQLKRDEYNLKRLRKKNLEKK